RRRGRRRSCRPPASATARWRADGVASVELARVRPYPARTIEECVSPWLNSPTHKHVNSTWDVVNQFKINRDSGNLRRAVQTVYQLPDAGERDAHPVRPVVQLVGELVQRLVERERGQQRLPIVGRARQNRRVADRRRVAADE